MLAHFVKEDYAQAIEVVRRHAALRPNWPGSQILLAASCALLGRQTEAQAAAQRLLELVPKFTLARGMRRPMFAREKDIIRLFDGLRVSDSFLMMNNIREILFRKPAYETR